MRLLEVHHVLLSIVPVGSGFQRVSVRNPCALFLQILFRKVDRGVRHVKKSIDLLGLIPSEECQIVEALRTLHKEEEIHLNAYQDIHEAREHIGHFIQQVYHHKRPHSALEYLTPMEFQRKNLS
ncbi:MAG: integrase core domain-containing protein [Candidatus Poribacteria bacterium]|nr:integrase core domain-containing protein [Candidatus Poribacteria bacterium]